MIKNIINKIKRKNKDNLLGSLEKCGYYRDRDVFIDFVNFDKENSFEPLRIRFFVFGRDKNGYVHNVIKYLDNGEIKFLPKGYFSDYFYSYRKVNKDECLHKDSYKPNYAESFSYYSYVTFPNEENEITHFDSVGNFKKELLALYSNIDKERYNVKTKKCDFDVFLKYIINDKIMEGYFNNKKYLSESDCLKAQEYANKSLAKSFSKDYFENKRKEETRKKLRDGEIHF